MKTKLLGRFGAWLCDRYCPRPSTKCENASASQYARLMADALRGEISFYGRDREENHVAVVAERKDYARIYGRGGENGN